MGDGCDCGCGARDPDCDVDSLSTCWNLTSATSNTCNELGICILTHPPSEWRCSPSFFNASDGCDCNCGAWDPDW